MQLKIVRCTIYYQCFFNPHNIKAICTALRINGIAYGNLLSANGRIHDFLQFIYGEKLANNGLLTNL